MNKPILLALDGSPRAAGVRDAAVALARATGRKLHVFRAVTFPPEIPAQAFEVSPNELMHVLEREARAALTKESSAIPGELVASVDVRIGTPWQAICQAGIDSDADLIVIGSHGYGGIDRVLGTTAGKVVNHADRSVLVVRPTPETKS